MIPGSYLKNEVLVRVGFMLEIYKNKLYLNINNIQSR